MSADHQNDSSEKLQNDSEEDEVQFDEPQEKKQKKIKKPGIIYMPTIPPNMTVLKLREILQEFGDIGRVFLQPDEKPGKSKRKPGVNFTEGWVEFKSKKAAKYVAEVLNNNKISTRKKHRYHDHVWNIKYLPNFKWAHLSERLAYERAVHRQRMRTEVAQAKREAHHFQASVERSDKIRRFRKKQQLEEVMAEKGFEVPQRLLSSEHQAKKMNRGEKEEDRGNLLQSFFGNK